MAQQPVEMILARQLAGYLFVPVLVVDTAGTVVFYNEPAERILGVRFEETGRIDREEADRLIELSDDPGAGPDDSGRPLITALQQRRPAHARRWLLRRSDRVRLQVELTAFPVIDQEDRLLGAVAMLPSPRRARTGASHRGDRPWRNVEKSRRERLAGRGWSAIGH